MIEESYVSLDTAKLLKEAGFDEVCSLSYCSDKGDKSFFHERNSDLTPEQCSCPTQTLAARWLREVHGIHVCTDVSASGWYYSLCKSDNGTHILWSSYQGPNDGGKWDSYEEAMEAGLQEAIKLIKK